MKNLKTVVLQNGEIADGYFRMAILAPGYTRAAQPGQFVMLRIQEQIQPLLRRPFGIYRAAAMPAQCSGLPEREFVELIYKVVGKGTTLMTTLKPGDSVELLGPLGEGFTIDSNINNHLLVGGGIGIVPLYMLAQQLCKRGDKVRLLMGGRSRDDILCISEFERLGVDVNIATEDGSLGETGLVTAVLERELLNFPQAGVYACGPMPMLSAVQAICCSAHVLLQVSLEALMACGIGACLGCVVPGREHSDDTPQYLCTCRQGPVFAAEDLAWPSRSNNDCHSGQGGK
ncbi:MAG: dihydroorotate dehydrogenase electron transfer subunit [Desulfobacteraceae bacterium 4572_35.1]|nr:MAG: dihydroorotate dehydrogenase electron transfer subunit [Desulfobacteraceae bacterium 4572_35.1]